MTETELFIPDERMLKLMEWAIKNDIVGTQREYFEKIEFAWQSLTGVQSGKQGFTKARILNACKLTGASADYMSVCKC